MSNNFDEILKKAHKNNQQTAKKALESYLEQLMVHYELNEKETVSLLQNVLKDKRCDSIKKWWQFFK